MTSRDDVRAFRNACWQHQFRPVAIWSPGALDSKGQPIKGAGKRPAGLNWREKALRNPPYAVTAPISSSALNTGLLSEEVAAVDVDVPVQPLADQIVHCIERTLGPTPLVRIGRSPKILLVYRRDTPLAKLFTPELYLPDGTKMQVEVLGVGQQFVADGIHPDTGQPYTWTDGSPATVPLAELPVVDEYMLRAMLADCEALLRAAGAVEKEVEEKPRPRPKTRQRSAANGSDFFHNVNSVALGDITAWAEELLPRGRYSPNGAYRISSAVLGRNLQEDLSIHPSGIYDFGTEEPRTPIDMVIDYGDAADAVAAALWLCGRLGLTPESLGWRADTSDDVRSVDYPRFITVEDRTFGRVDENLWRALDGYELRIRAFDLGGADRLFEFRAPGGRHWWPHLGAAEFKAHIGTSRDTEPATSGEESKAGSADPSVGAGKTRQCPPATQREAAFKRKLDWRHDLLKTRDKKICACLANAMIALRNAPEWEDRIWFDVFHNRAVLRGAPPWSNKNFDDEPWSDLFDNLTTNWMQHQGIMVGHEIAGRAVWTVAHDQWFHPVRQYLEGCRRAWDGQKRVETWTTSYLATPDTPYSRGVGSRWLISLVARVMEPGCKADCALVLEGQQGILKSELLRRLGHPWVTDDMGGSDPGSKDAAIQVAGIWIFELAELDQFTAGRERDVARIKSFMSRPTDRFRPPYGRHAVPQPRQCGFACTTNKREYLPDETGNRRWWPLSCSKIDLYQLVLDRDQLFGEAVALYERGDPWWLDTPELNTLATAEQEGRYMPDSWDASISNYLDHPTVERDDKQGRKITVVLSPLDSVTVPAILKNVIGLPIGYWGQGDQNRVARSLRKLGWERKQKQVGGDREWRYWRPKAE